MAENTPVARFFRGSRLLQRKDGQTIGEVFIYIVAIVLVALILVYGYKAIRTLNKDIEDVSVIKFQTNLQNTIDRVAADYGSVKIYNEKDPLNVPSSYNFVCFADTSDANAKQNAAQLAGDFPLIQDSLSGAYAAKENIFLVDKDLKQALFIDKLKVDGFFFCTPIVQGKIYLAVEGFGDYAKISRAR